MGRGGAGADLYTLVTRDRTGRNSIKLSRRRFSLDSRNRFPEQSAFGHQSRILTAVLSLTGRPRGRERGASVLGTRGAW